MRGKARPNSFQSAEHTPTVEHFDVIKEGDCENTRITRTGKTRFPYSYQTI